MNGLYSLRHRPTREESLFPNIQGQPPPETENVSQNTLLELYKIAQKLKEQPKPDIGENILLNKYATSPLTDIKERGQMQVPETPFEARTSAPFNMTEQMLSSQEYIPRPRFTEFAEKPHVGISPEPTTGNALYDFYNPPTTDFVSPEKIPMKNALLGIPAPVTQKPTNSLLDYWKQPVIGKMPLDQFVQVAGMLGHALAPETPMGRAGAGLAQIGGAAYGERIRREGEEPTNVLRRRLMEAQTKKLEAVEAPEVTGNVVRDPTSDTGYSYINKQGNIIAKNAPSPKEPTGQYKDRIVNIDGVDTLVRKELISGKDYIVGKATPKDIEDIQTGKIKEPKEYEPHQYVKPDGTIGWVEPGKEVPPGWKPYEKEAKVTPHWETVKDPKSPTGWSRQDMNNPTEPLRTGAPPPSVAKPTEAERDPDAHAFSAAITDAKKTEQTPLFMEKLSEAEQQRSEARLRKKTKSNYLARGGNPKKFDQFFAEGVYGVPTLDKADIVKLKEFSTPDEAISYTERAFRANMISPEVKDQAIALINKNRKKWDDWRKTQ